MKPIHRKLIDWEKTGWSLQRLRLENTELRRSVCSALKHDKCDCSGECESCKYEMDNHISRKELSDVFSVSESVIFNWETGRTEVGYEDLLFYAQLSGKDLSELIIFMERNK